MVSVLMCHGGVSIRLWWIPRQRFFVVVRYFLAEQVHKMLDVVNAVEPAQGLYTGSNERGRTRESRGTELESFCAVFKLNGIGLYPIGNVQFQLRDAQGQTQIGNPIVKRSENGFGDTLSCRVQ